MSFEFDIPGFRASIITDFKDRKLQTNILPLEICTRAPLFAFCFSLFTFKFLFRIIEFPVSIL